MVVDCVEPSQCFNPRSRKAQPKDQTACGTSRRAELSPLSSYHPRTTSSVLPRTANYDAPTPPLPTTIQAQNSELGTSTHYILRPTTTHILPPTDNELSTTHGQPTTFHATTYPPKTNGLQATYYKNTNHVFCCDFWVF